MTRDRSAALVAALYDRLPALRAEVAGLYAATYPSVAAAGDAPPVAEDALIIEWQKVRVPYSRLPPHPAHARPDERAAHIPRRQFCIKWGYNEEQQRAIYTELTPLVTNPVSP